MRTLLRPDAAGYAHHVGRVGALAVALGVGSAAYNEQTLWRTGGNGGAGGVGGGKGGNAQANPIGNGTGGQGGLGGAPGGSPGDPGIAV